MKPKNSAYTSPEICVIELISSEGILAASDSMNYEETGDFENIPEIPGVWN